MNKFFLKTFFRPEVMGEGFWETMEYLNYPVWIPPVDIYEDNEGFTVEAEVPGVDEKDINIKIENNMLQISGIRRATIGGELTLKLEKCHMLEREQGYFLRRFVLPSEVDTDRIRASIKDGILTIVIPKFITRHIKIEDGQ